MWFHTYLHSTDLAWREKKCKHFVFNEYFFLVLGLLKSRISEKINQPFLNNLKFKLFHYKARVQCSGYAKSLPEIGVWCKNDRVQFVPHDHFKKKSAHFLY